MFAQDFIFFALDMVYTNRISWAPTPEVVECFADGMIGSCALPALRRSDEAARL
jgi:hypothetical protein